MLVASDLRGVESHGVAHLHLYANRIKDGIINANLKPEIFSKSPVAATMDGDRGLGFVIGYRAMREAIQRADKAGAGFVSVRNSTHFGAAAYYSMMALEHDMIGISMTNAPARVVTPVSLKPAVGTNPISVAVPADKKPPFVLDMATSVVAAGKLEIAEREGTSIPEGWAIDKEGKPLTDPTKRVAGEGGILPLGGTPTLRGYKGSGLGVLVDILCGLLSGASASVFKEGPGTDYNHFFGALSIDNFLPIENFKKSMDGMIEAIEALPPVPGVDKVYVAGSYEDEIVKDREANGIPLHYKVIKDLQQLAKEISIEYDL
jgi:LDH2 family malate/lactate/ureidoglycolate dehydrogenase